MYISKSVRRTLSSIGLLFWLLTNPISGMANPVVQDAILKASIEKKVKETSLALLEKPTFKLKAEPRSFMGSADIFEYLLDHLDVCARASRTLGLSDYYSRREPDGRLYGEDSDAIGYLTMVNEAPGERVLYLEGEHKGLFSLKGKSILYLTYKDVPGSKNEIQYDMLAWNKVQNSFFAFFSKVFLNFSRRTADKKFAKMISVPGGLAEYIHQNPKESIKTLEAHLMEDPATSFARLIELIQIQYPS